MNFNELRKVQVFKMQHLHSPDLVNYYHYSFVYNVVEKFKIYSVKNYNEIDREILCKLKNCI